MKTPQKWTRSKPWLHVATALTAVGVVTVAAWAASSPDAKQDPKPAAKPAPAKKLTGEQLFAINCNRCHAERYSTERTAAQWKTLLTHMRVRANLPAEQAKAILKYLQENAGKE